MERQYLQAVYLRNNFIKNENVKIKEEINIEKKKDKKEKKGEKKSNSGGAIAINQKLKKKELEELLNEMGECLTAFRAPNKNKKYKNKKVKGGTIQII